MDKKPPIEVSICTVVLIVMVSLTNVVGYQSVKSTAVNESPLFSMRTQRATNQQQGILTSQYLGMGKGNLLQFPIRDNRTEQLKKAIDIINKMDDTEFERLTELCIQQSQEVNTLRNTNPNEIIRILRLMKTKPEIVINHLIKKNNQKFTLSDYYTICNWFPGCVIAIILYNIPDILMFIIFFVFMIVLNITSRYSIVLTCVESICDGTRCR
jgi:phage-related protein